MQYVGIGYSRFTDPFVEIDRTFGSDSREVWNNCTQTHG